MIHLTNICTPPLLASLLRQRGLDGRRLIHANAVDYDPGDVRLRARWRSVFVCFCTSSILFINLVTSWICDFPSRFPLWRVRAQAFPRTHGRMFGDSRSRPRGRPAQVTNTPLYVFDAATDITVGRICRLLWSQINCIVLLLFSRVVHYEGGAVCSHARSLWRLEPLRIG